MSGNDYLMSGNDWLMSGDCAASTCSLRSTTSSASQCTRTRCCCYFFYSNCCHYLAVGVPHAEAGERVVLNDGPRERANPVEVPSVVVVIAVAAAVAVVSSGRQ